MTNNQDDVIHDKSFKLDGHDCPLGEYPSVVVPVGKVGSEIVVVYTGDGKAQFDRVSPDAKYCRHNQTTAGTLRGFDPRRHGLFAISYRDILIYDLGKEKAFYSRLLRSSAAFYIESFYRLSLAFETDEASLIRPIYFRCAEQLARHLPEYPSEWIRATRPSSPLIAEIQMEVLRKLEQPRIERNYDNEWSSQVSSDASLSLPERRRLEMSVEPDMSAVTIRDALTKLILQDASFKIDSSDVYAMALQTSLGFSESRPSSSTFSTTELSFRRNPPTSQDVAIRSGLSLPHLEFKNLILNKPTAIQFLDLSQAGLPTDLLNREVLTAWAYLQHFGRPAIKVKQRLVFSYAEVLSMVGYLGNVEFPSLPERL